MGRSKGIYPAAAAILELNPYNTLLDAHHEEIATVAMLLGEFVPVICAECYGAGKVRGIFGGMKECVGCQAHGYTHIGAKTFWHFKDGHHKGEDK